MRQSKPKLMISMYQWLPSQPIRQFIKISRGENIIQSIFGRYLSGTKDDRQQMQVMIAKYSDRRIAKILDKAQGL